MRGMGQDLAHDVSLACFFVVPFNRCTIKLSAFALQFWIALVVSSVNGTRKFELGAARQPSQRVKNELQAKAVWLDQAHFIESRRIVWSRRAEQGERSWLDLFDLAVLLEILFASWLAFGLKVHRWIAWQKTLEKK